MLFIDLLRKMDNEILSCFSRAIKWLCLSQIPMEAFINAVQEVISGIIQTNYF